MQFRKAEILITSFKGYANPRKIHGELCDFFSLPRGCDIILNADDALNDITELIELASGDGPYSSDLKRLAVDLLEALEQNQGVCEYVWVDY